jgi:hypothetical protein
MSDDEDIAALVIDNGSGMCKGETIIVSTRNLAESCQCHASWTSGFVQCCRRYKDCYGSGSSLLECELLVVDCSAFATMTLTLSAVTLYVTLDFQPVSLETMLPAPCFLR